MANTLLSAARRMVPNLSKGLPVVYFLCLKSGVVYVGSSTDLEQRLTDHFNGQACRTTQIDSAVSLLRVETFATFSDARKREAQLKRWSRAKKAALISGDTDELRALSRSRENAEAKIGVA